MFDEVNIYLFPRDVFTGFSWCIFANFSGDLPTLLVRYLLALFPNNIEYSRLKPNRISSNPPTLL